MLLSRLLGWYISALFTKSHANNVPSRLLMLLHSQAFRAVSSLKAAQAPCIPVAAMTQTLINLMFTAWFNGARMCVVVVGCS